MRISVRLVCTNFAANVAKIIPGSYPKDESNKKSIIGLIDFNLFVFDYKMIIFKIHHRIVPSNKIFIHKFM